MRITRFKPCLVVAMLLGASLPALAAETALPVPATKSPEADVAGWRLLLQAAKAYGADTGPKGSPDAGDAILLPAEDLARQRATVARNAKALTSVHAALQLGIMRPQDADGLTDSTIAEDKSIRALTGLLIQESRVFAADKNWDGAAESALAIVDLYVQMPRGGVLMNAWQGWAWESIGMRELRALEPRLPAATLRKTDTRLMQLDATRVSIAETVRNERAYSLNKLKQEFSDAQRAKLAKMKYEDLPAEAKKDITRADFENYKMTAEESTAEFQAHTDLLIAWANEAPGRDWKKPPILPVARNMLTRMLDQLWQERSAIFTRARIASFGRLLAVDMAARAFNADKGRWPATLDELAPEYLAAVPLDPFSGEAFKWKVREGEPLLYSIGPDEVDDGGKPIGMETKPAGGEGPAGLPARPTPTVINRVVKVDSKGDIVHGINP